MSLQMSGGVGGVGGVGGGGMAAGDGGSPASPAGESSLTCPICHKRAVSKYFLSEHVRQHTGGFAFVCTQCTYKTNRSHNLKRHMQSRHSGDQQRPIRCHLCPYLTMDALLLHAHFTNEHPSYAHP
ncbi:protein krueppel-like [Penaeus japonicus]|uniref:protein krueppel-like n=1 Tax=Penaeus japonicus TaxID=27405 RepID=UPI001C715E54|nr:protein krueppel-like [Penaeus japonicus]